MNNFFKSLGLSELGVRQPRSQSDNNGNNMQQQQTGKNIYSSNNYLQNTLQHNNQAAQQFNNSRDPTHTNVIPTRGFNQNIVNDTHLDSPFAQNQTEQYVVSQLSGQRTPMEHFSHNNMQPYFSGQVNQNTRKNAHTSILENYTGTGDVYKNKSEVPRMFDLEKNVSNPYGAPNYNSDEAKSRFIPSQNRTNELPFSQVQVGPGVNRGYSADPSGGLNQANVREFVMPKDTNELRPLTKPKLSYEGRIVAGLKEAQRGMVTSFKKQKPPRHYKNSSDRYFKTGGGYRASKLRSQIYKKPTKRAQTKSYFGGPVSTWNKKTYKIPAIKKSHKHNYLQPWGRNLGRDDGWTHQKDNDEKAIGDYGKQAIEIKNNERDITQHRKHYSNIASIVKALTVPVQDLLRDTRKEHFIGNYRPDGHFKAQLPAKQTVYDPNDVARTTIKETTIENDHSGNIASQMPNKGTVYDPNDLARTTLKETTIENDHSGNIAAQMPNKGTVHDPNDIARATIKETTIENDHSGNVNPDMPSKGTVYDPNDSARTTIKQTTIENDHSGNIGPAKPAMQTVHDPNDVARTTLKEQTIHGIRTGSVGLTGASKHIVYDPNDVAKTTGKELLIHNEDPNVNLVFTGPKKLTTYDPNDIPRTTTKEITLDAANPTGYMQSINRDGMGYHIAEMMPKHTQKQFLSDYEYYGIADGDVGRGGGEGYLVNKYDARNTNRQFSTDYEYGGIAGPSGPGNPMSYAAGYMARLNPNKEQIAQGRAPTVQNVKIANGADKVYIQPRKLDEDRINIREPQETRFYSMPPQKNICGLTKDKDGLTEDIQRERIDPNILDAFRANPYTKPLDSVFGDKY
jgi:hypothetical protein